MTQLIMNERSNVVQAVSAADWANENLQQIITEWLAGKRTRTQVVYKAEMKRFMQWLHEVGETDLMKVNHTLLSKYQTFLNTTQYEHKAGEWRNYSPSAVNLSLNTVRSFYRFLFEHDINIDEQLFKKLPTRKIKMEKETNKHNPKKLIPKEMIIAMVMTEKDQRNKAMMAFMATTGVRVSELIGMRFADLIDKSPTEFTVWVREGKGGKSRHFNINKDSLNVYNLVMALNRRGKDDDHVFASTQIGRNGQTKSLSAMQVNRILKAAAERVGLPHVSAHMFRHSLITYANRGGMNWRDLQVVTGHSDIKTLLGYIHASKEVNASSYLGF